MKTLLCIIFTIATIFRANAVISYDPKDWPAYNFKLSPQGTLKDVYDSGIRPWLSPGSETSFLSFKHARVSVQTHEEVQLPEFPVEYADIYCLPDGRLKGIVMVSPSQPFANARNLIVPWFPLMGKNEVQLDAFFKIVKENQIGYEDPDFGKAPEGFRGVWIDSGKTSYGIGFRNNKNPNLPFRLEFGIGWMQLLNRKDRGTTHTDPIKPPPGYENESLLPPKNWGPDSMLDKMRALDLDTGESPEAVAEPRRNGERPPLKTDAPGLFPTGAAEQPNAVKSPAMSIPMAKPSSKDLHLWLWLSGLFALVLTIWVVFKRRS